MTTTKRLVAIGLQYDSGMNFHRLEYVGPELGATVRELLAGELRRRYRELLLAAEKQELIELESDIGMLKREDRFHPIAIPCGNQRFKHIYLIPIQGDLDASRRTCSDSYDQFSLPSIRQVAQKVREGDLPTIKRAEAAVTELLEAQSPQLSQAIMLGALLVKLETSSKFRERKNSAVWESSRRPWSWLRGKQRKRS